MSHFATLKTKMTNRNAIVAALETMGYTFEVHDQGVELNTRYEYVSGNLGRLANVIIRAENIPRFTAEEIASRVARDGDDRRLETYQTSTVGADVGFTLQPDGTYSITADSYYPAHQRIEAEIKHQYARAVITEQALALGHDYTVSARQDEQGRFLGWTIEVQPDEIEYMGVSSTYNSASLISQY